MKFDCSGCLGHQLNPTVMSIQVHTHQVGDCNFHVIVACCQIRYNRLTQHPGDGPSHNVEMLAVHDEGWYQAEYCNKT